MKLSKSLTQEKALIKSGKEIWPSIHSASPLNVLEADFLKIMSSPLYKQMTIRSWDTTARLLELMNAMEH